MARADEGGDIYYSVSGRYATWTRADRVNENWSELKYIGYIAAIDLGTVTVAPYTMKNTPEALVRESFIRSSVELEPPMLLPETTQTSLENGLSSRVSQQRQFRHMLGRPEYRGGGYLENINDAQSVLDAYRSGRTTVLGKSEQGFPVVRYEGVTGTNVNPGAGFPNQPTNVFMIKGTSRPSIVPMSPEWTPR